MWCTAHQQQWCRKDREAVKHRQDRTAVDDSSWHSALAMLVKDANIAAQVVVVICKNCVEGKTDAEQTGSCSAMFEQGWWGLHTAEGSPAVVALV